MRLNLKYGFVILLLLGATATWGDTLELKNGSLIKGKFLGGTESEIRFQVSSTVQEYRIGDVVSLKFDSEGAADTPVLQQRKSSRPAQASLPDSPAPEAPVEAKLATVTIPAGTRITVRTIDSIDSARDFPGDRFQASLAEPLVLDGNVIVPQDALVYGQLTQSKESGTFTGRSELRLELTGIVVNEKMVPLVTGEYEASGKSRGASTAKRTVGVAALGAIIGAAADGGKGAAIGAGVGAGAGAGSEIITRGDQVKVPSETVIDFTLEQDLSIPTRPN